MTGVYFTDLRGKKSIGLQFGRVYSLFTRCFIKLIYTAAQVRNTLMLIWNLYFLSLEHWFFEIQHYQMNSWITSIIHLSCLNLANLLSLCKLYQSTLLNKKQHEYVHRRKRINVLGSVRSLCHMCVITWDYDPNFL